VHSDLVHATGFQHYSDQREISERLFGPIGCSGVTPACGKHRHALTVPGIPTDARLNRAGPLL
jgi:hypothetical protein